VRTNWTDWSWAWAHRFFAFTGGLWITSLLIGPSFQENWILVLAAIASLASLLIVRPGARA
jgi:hypothetical protein